MIFLQNKDLFQKIGVLEKIDSGMIEEMDRSVLNNYPHAKIMGSYGFVGGKALAVIRVEENMYLRIDEIAVNWNEILSVALDDLPGNKRRLSVVATTSKFDLEYDRPIIDPPLSSVFEPFSEEEDFDFGLFVKHLADNPARRKGD